MDFGAEMRRGRLGIATSGGLRTVSFFWCSHPVGQKRIDIPVGSIDD